MTEICKEKTMPGTSDVTPQFGQQNLPLRDGPIQSPMTWAAGTLLENDGLVRLQAQHLDELYAVAKDLQENPLPTEALRPEYFDMPACAALMGEVRGQLDNGIGFAIIDRLPVDELDTAIATKLYWLLMNQIGQPVAQKWDGTLLYDVTDTTQTTAAGNGVRSSKTSAGQGYHVDNAFNLPPDFVGLFCLQTALEGGMSGLISFETVYNKLLDQHPQVLPRLAESFYFDRQREHAPDDRPVNEKPMIERAGDSIAFNFSPRLVRQGYQLAGVDLDDRAESALSAIDEIAEAPGMGKSFAFERGQIQIVNNRRLGHRRTAYTDHVDPARRRHLVRVWIRNSGRPFYLG
jgi:alpha-ketoglutarate-dependent taurine dioxygenase